MGKKSRTKGYGYEREIVNWHRDMGLRAERVPLSGGARYQGGGHDVDIYKAGRDAPLCCEAKRRKQLPAWLVGWLGSNDALFMRDDHGETLVVVPARVWVELVK